MNLITSHPGCDVTMVFRLHLVPPSFIEASSITKALAKVIGEDELHFKGIAR